MGAVPDQTTLDQWYSLGSATSLRSGTRNQLLGRDIANECVGDAISAGDAATGRPLPIFVPYEMLWTLLGQPPAALSQIAEADEPDRRTVDCGPVLIRASGLRTIENLLNMAHFQFVHTNILSAKPHAEVAH